MKKIIYLLLIPLMALASCDNSENNNEDKVAEENQNAITEVMSVDQIYSKADSLTDKEIIFKGTVDHVCKHSGKRAFVFGNDENTRIKILAEGEIEGFDAELIGSDIEVKGILRELRIDEAYINKMEDDMNKNMGGEGNEHADEEEHQKQQDQIKKLREEIAATEKGYKSTYHVEGISYKKID